MSMANVLIVDDEYGIRESLKLILEKEGHNATAVDDALKAQQILNKKNFDIIVTDIYMPQATGIELLKSIQSFSPDTKVILFTGNPSVDTATEAMRIGAFDYIRKPVSRADLLKSINNALHTKILEEENKKYRENLEKLVEDQTRIIRDKEKKYRLLAENVDDVLWTMDLDFHLTYISPSIKNLLGYIPEEITDSFFREIMTPVKYNKMLKILQKEFSIDTLTTDNQNLHEVKSMEFQFTRKDERTIWVELKINFMIDVSGEPVGIIGVIRDISDRKRYQLQLIESEENFRNVAENAMDGIIISLEGEGKSVYANNQASRLTGYKIDELLNTSVERLLASDEYMKIINLYRARNYTTPASNRYETIIMRADQQRIPVEFSSTKTVWHDEPADMIFLRDISERKIWETNIRTEKNKIKQYLDIVDVIIVAINANQEVTLINRKGREILGYSEEEILGKNWFINFLPQNEYGHTLNMFKKFLAGELEPFYYNEYKIVNKRGEERIIAWRNVVLNNERGVITGILSSGEDITNRLAMEIQLRSSERRLNTIINSNADGIIVTSNTGTVLFANPAAEIIMGKRIHELIGNPFGFFIEADKVSEIEIFHKDMPDSIIAEMTVVDIEWANKTAFLVVLRNITEQKRTRDNIVKLSQFQQSVIDNANVWVYVIDKNSNIIIWNKAAEKISGYTEQEATGHNYIWKKLYPDNAYREQIENRIKEGLLNKDFIEDFDTIITTRYGEQKSILWYMRNMHNDSGGTIGSLFLGRDISMQKFTEEKLQISFKKLKSALDGTIKAVSLSLETRDPYTSGHQKRVALIAKTIALELELPADTIEAIYIAGSMHDIGKISVPVEILTKPDKLTDPEFAIIKEHSRIGYDILKPIEFPWPIAEIVYQHHEYCDGSGYPRQLKEDEICIEARILTVADIIEAISSYRPYRPALGIDEAIAEISRFRGIRFDEQVVDATLHLFHVKKYNFGIIDKVKQ